MADNKRKIITFCGSTRFRDLFHHIHRDMIAMSDAILVVNKGGYIGHSTEEEIEFAKALCKDIKYFELPKIIPPIIEANNDEEGE